MKPFLEEVAADLVAKFGNDLQHCAIVFNNKRPAAYLQKYLAEIFKKPFFSPAFFTVQEFFAEAGNYKNADFYRQFYTLFQVYNDLLKEENLQPLKSHKFFPLAKIILSDFNQIDADLVDANLLYQELEDIAVINKEFDYLSAEQYAFLQQFWQSYAEGKHKKQQELFIKMWRRMPKLYHKFHEALRIQEHITGGGAYRQLAEADLQENSFINGFKGKIAFVGFNALSKSEAKIFTRLQELQKAIFYFDTDGYYLHDELQEAGLFLRRNLNQLKLKNEFEAGNMFDAEKHQLNLYKVQGQSAQAKILNHILEDDYQKNEVISSTAVILADESLLIPALQTIPNAIAGKAIDLNVTMGYPLGSSAVFGLADLWLSTQLEILHNRQISYQNLEAFLTHPLTGISQKMRDKIQSALLNEKINTVDVTRLINQKGIFELFFQEITEPNQITVRLLEVLHLVLNRLSTARLLKKIDADLFVKTIQELNRLQDTVGKYIANEERAFVISLVQKALQGIAVPLSGNPLSGIQLMGLLESRNLNFEKIVFLGFNEGIVPKTNIGNSFIPDSLRRVYGLPVLENQDAISSYMVYRLLQRAKHISFVYNSLTDESTSGEVSRIFKQLQYESRFEVQEFDLSLEVKTEQSPNIQISKKHPFIQNALQKYLRKERSLSPSAFTQYLSNPIDFFFRYIADIREPEEVSAVIEANQVGSILHKVMEYFYEGSVGKVVEKEFILAGRKKIPAIIQKAYAAVMFNDEAKVPEFTGMQQVILAIVDAYADIILKQDESQSPFKLISLEQKITAEIRFPVYGRMESINLFGLIDRVDEKDGVTRIIDYKTGSDVLTFKNIEELFNTDGKHINKALVQTLMYTYAFEQFSGKTEVEPNLYVVKSMSAEGVWFKSGRQTLNGAYLEEIKPQFLAALQDKLTELFEAEFFNVSAVADNYKYSIYKTLFGE